MGPGWRPWCSFAITEPLGPLTTEITSGGGERVAVDHRMVDWWCLVTAEDFLYDTCEVGVFLGCAYAFTDAATELDDGVTVAVYRLQQVGVPAHRHLTLLDSTDE